MYLGGKSRWVSLVQSKMDELHGTERHQAFTYGANRMSQHKNLSINTKSNQYLQTCTEKTSSAHSY